MINRDFLKQVLNEEKTLLHMDAVKRIHVPLFDELSVARLYPMMSTDKAFMKHFPDRMPKGRLPDRTFFFNLLNTY